MIENTAPSWQATWHPAPTQLAGVLVGIWSVIAGQDAELAARVLPDWSTCLVFKRDGTLLQSRDNAWQPWSAMCVSGPRSGPFDFKLCATGHIFIAQLHPEGAMRALGVPMSLLANAVEELDAVVGPELYRLGDHIQDCLDEHRCIRAIERWLCERIRMQHLECPTTVAVVGEIRRSAGNVRVSDLAERVNLSRRHLARIMADRLGAPPKLVARITRFNRAVQLSRLQPAPPWVQVALEAGYADQAHLVRDFRNLGGIRPGDLRGPDAATIW